MGWSLFWILVVWLVECYDYNALIFGIFVLAYYVPDIIKKSFYENGSV